MARIEFRNLGHAYGKNPQSPSEFALQPMNMVWEDARGVIEEVHE